MSGYSTFPPFPKFKRVLQSCPRAALLFTELWEARSKTYTVKIKKTELPFRFPVTKTLMRNHLVSLSQAEVLTFEESLYGFAILFTFDDSHEKR